MTGYKVYKDSIIPWIGQIPAHWETRRAKYMFKKEKRDVRPEDRVITCFRDGQVTLRENRRTTGFTESITEVGYQGIRKGDLVIHQMDAFAGSIGVSDSDGKGTSVYHCCTPTGPYIPQYYAYALREMARAGFIQSLYRGIRERSTDFNFFTFGRQFLPVPPIEEQKRIVAFLDKKITLIESCKCQRERELQTLNEFKQAEIASVVTRGLNPHVPMKDSGIPWIGQIPAHWNMKYLFQVAREHYISNKEIHHQNLLSLSYGKIVRKDINTTDGLLPASFDTYQVIEPGNIVFRFTDLQNDHKSLRVGLSKETGIITSAYVVVEVDEYYIMPEFFYYTLHSFDIKKLFYSMGGGLRQSLNYNGIRKLNVPIPPIEEQRAIVSFIEKRADKIETMIQSLKLEIEHLSEYKQRLISDVITGQMNVQD